MGKKRVAVSCPSFATDCLETLEEIQIGLGEEFKAKFSGELHLIPCLNDDKTWVQNASAYLQTLI
jgi:ferrochelatase